MSKVIRMLNDKGEAVEVDLYRNTQTTKTLDGKTVTMDLGQADVHIDSALASYCAGYNQWEGIADMVAGVVPVPKASDKFFTWDKDDVFQNVEDLIVGPGGAVAEVSPRVSNSSFSTISYGIGSAVTTELMANADAPLKPELAAVRRCLTAMNLGREARVATLVTASGSWTGGYSTTLSATQKWNGGSASDPVKDLLTACEGSLTPVTAIAMSERTYHDFMQNAAVQKYVAAKTALPPLPAANASNQSNIKSDFSALLGLPPFLIGRMKKKATSSTYGYVWGDNVALLCTTPGVPTDGQTISTAKTFRWTGADNTAPDGTQQGGFLVRSYFDPRRGARGTKVVVVTVNDSETMTSVYAGGLIINAHQ